MSPFDRRQIMAQQREAVAFLDSQRTRLAPLEAVWRNPDKEPVERNLAFAEWMQGLCEVVRLGCMVGESGVGNWPHEVKPMVDNYRDFRLQFDEIVLDSIENGVLHLAKQDKEEADDRARLAFLRQEQQRRRYGRTLEVVGG